MTPLHRAAQVGDPEAPSPARAPTAAVFLTPAELRASPSTSGIVVMGLEGWEGARSAGPTTRFREFCLAALCLPSRLILHVTMVPPVPPGTPAAASAICACLPPLPPLSSLPAAAYVAQTAWFPWMCLAHGRSRWPCGHCAPR